MIARSLLALLAPLLGAATLMAPPIAGAAMTGYSAEALTWDTIGLDSNNTAAGPDSFPVGWRLCNTSGTASASDTATLTWGAAGGTGATAISLESPSTSATVPALAAGACTDVYFVAQVVRNASSYGASRQFTLLTGAHGPSGVRQLYVEHLVSQHRNTTVQITGQGGCSAGWITGGGLGTCTPAPISLAVGATYTYALYAETATPYDEIESFITFPGALFRVNWARTRFETPAVGLLQPWGDGCTWAYTLAPPAGSAGPGACGAGSTKYGNRVIVTYNVTVLAAGTGTLESLIYDYSGSSFHYNSDFGGGLSPNIATSVVPLAPATVTVVGDGSVSANAGAVNDCTATSGTCTDTYPTTDTVTFTATPGPGQVLVAWGGACSGAGPTCTVSMAQSQSVTATFGPAPATETAASGSTGTAAGTLVLTSKLDHHVFTGGSKGTLTLTVTAVGGASAATTVRMPVPVGFRVCTPLPKNVKVIRGVVVWSPVPALAAGRSAKAPICVLALGTRRPRAVVFRPSLRTPDGHTQVRRNPALVRVGTFTGVTG